MTIIITSDIDDSDRIVSDDSDNCQRPTSKDMQLKRTMEKAGKVHPPSHLLSPLVPPWWAPIMSGFLRPVGSSFARFLFKIKGNYPCANRQSGGGGNLEWNPPCDDMPKEMGKRCKNKWENCKWVWKRGDQNLSSFSRLNRQSNQRIVKTFTGPLKFIKYKFYPF